MKREALADKIIVVGVDGMDPRLTNKYLKMGLMPNVQKILDRGVAREDLVLLGGQPTVTPPMWTTLATGAYPMTHGITCFNGQGDNIDQTVYNITSTRCHAEQLWNVFAEAGKKTLVWHWPGSSWPPSSDSPNLSVVDGLTPAVVNAMAILCGESMVMASVNVKESTFVPKAASDGNVPCVIDSTKDLHDAGDNMGATGLILRHEDGEHALSDSPFDVALSPITEPEGWGFDTAGAKECTFLFCNGMVRRPALILKNADGVYDRIALYKNKKTDESLIVMENGKFYADFVDDGFKNDKKVRASRHMRVLEMAEDGSKVRVWISCLMDIDFDGVWHPQSLYKDVVAHCGYPKPHSIVGGGDKQLIEDCMGVAWDLVCDWYADCLNYLIKEHHYEIIFSHVHNVDLQGHMMIRHLKDHGSNKLSEAEYERLVRRMYIQTDNYIGKFVHLLDEGWTVLVVSDHAAVASEYEPLLMGDCTGINVRLMQELGFTSLKKDADGNDLYEIDWEHTIAVAPRGNHIYLNLKGREPYGIVDPADKYATEEKIMTALYGYKHPESGNRVIALALRNKDAVLLGMGGPECGDIIYWNAEGYNYDHCDSLSTTLGYQDTSVSPIFLAAGPGLKSGVKTDRYIRMVDVAATIAVLGGVRMPRECEGAPAYQILSEEF